MAMPTDTLSRRVWLATAAAATTMGFGQSTWGDAKEPASLAIEDRKSGVTIRAGTTTLITYVPGDTKTPRPYCCSLAALDGTPLSRAHPPRAGVDLTDHDTFHPGLWLSFGDLSGSDFWRLTAKMKFVEFQRRPKVEEGRASLGATWEYTSAGGDRLCREKCELSLHQRAVGWRLEWDSTFEPLGAEIAFGDQEEMGLGVRMATPLMVQRGGTIQNSHGERNEKGCWGKRADWCDYSGVIDKRRYGLLLMPHPANPRPSSFHVRDYGLMVANPFAEKAFGRGAASQRTVVKRGAKLRLRFALLGYGCEDDKPLDAAAEWADYAQT